MQINVDSEILENIFVHAKNAAQLAKVGDTLPTLINELLQLVAGLLYTPYDPQLAEEVTKNVKPKFNVTDEVDLLRLLVAKVDALADAAQNYLDEMGLEQNDSNRRQFERLAHLVGATSTAVQEAMEFGNKLAIELVAHRSGSEQHTAVAAT